MQTQFLKRARGFLARLGLALLSLTVTLLVLEGVVRQFYPQQLILLRPDIWQPAEVVGWRHAPYLDTTVNTGERTVHVYTDAHGYRIGPGAPAPADTAFTILALGDSFVEAFQVEHDATFTARLAVSLSAALDHEVVVVNTGVSGWDPNQYRLEARTALARESVDLVLVFLYMPNDVVGYAAADIPRRDYAVRHTFSWPRHLTRDDLVTHLLYPINDTLETRSQLYIWARTQAQVLRTRLGLSPYYFPWMLRVENAAAPQWTVTVELCTALAQDAAQDGVPVLFVLLPGVMQVDDAALAWYLDVYGVNALRVDWDQPSSILTQALTARDLIVFDTTPDLRAAYSASRDAGLYGQVDQHFSPAGHRYVAHLLTDWLLTQHAALLTG